MGAAPGVPHAVDRPQLYGSDGPGVAGIRGGVRRRLVRSCPRHAERAALGRDNVSMPELRSELPKPSLQA